MSSKRPTKTDLRDFALQNGFTAMAVGQSWNCFKRYMDDSELAAYMGNEDVDLQGLEKFCEQLNRRSHPKGFGETNRELFLKWYAHLTRQA